MNDITERNVGLDVFPADVLKMLIVSLNPNAVPPELLVSLPGWILPTLNVKAFRK